MEVDKLILSDLDHLTDLQPETWTDITPHYKFYIDSDFCFPVKVTEANNLIGVGTSILHGNVAWFAHIIVHPEHRNKGVGNLLTKSLVDNIPSSIKKIQLIATELGAPVYEKVGFTIDTHYLGFNESTNNFAAYENKNIICYNTKYLPQIKKLDKLVSGEERFFRLQPYLHESRLFIEDGSLAGIYIPGFGEGLIIANNTIAGISLMQYRFKTNDLVILPEDNKAAIQFLQQNNFIQCKSMKRMWLGEKNIWQPFNLYNRIGGAIG